MDFLAATAGYETWLRSFAELNQDDLDYKYARMADRADPFPFFRGTYYRWAQIWADACPAMKAKPTVRAARRKWDITVTCADCARISS